MRGKAFHNQIATSAKTILNRYGWQVYTEYGYRKNGVITYFDLFAVKHSQRIACEIETTSRHGLDNAIKAQTVGIELWIIVPSRKLKSRIEKQLKSADIPASVILLGQLEVKLTNLSTPTFPKE